RVTVMVERVFYYSTFQTMQKREKNLTYICFKAADTIYLAHSVSMPPDFDQILTAKVSPSAKKISPQAMQVNFARPNSPDGRLKPGERLGGMIDGVNVDVEVSTEVIANLESLKEAMPVMPSPIHTGRPVATLPIDFEWHVGMWQDLFDKHVEFIQ